MAAWSVGAVFFFQAEDGIRDKLVTGVQTCALPIFDLLGLGMLAALEEAIPLVREHEGVEVDLAHLPPDDRSEERRVGKSVDLGGRRIIKKKTTTEKARRAGDIAHPTKPATQNTPDP